jgi:hypothetical protein
VVYSLAPRNQISTIDWYFESITIGYSVGLVPRDPRYQPNPWFSTWHILSGSSLIAILLIRAGKNVEEDTSMNMFEALCRREDYECKMRRKNPLPVRDDAFVWYNAALPDNDCVVDGVDGVHPGVEHSGDIEHR